MAAPTPPSHLGPVPQGAGAPDPSAARPVDLNDLLASEQSAIMRAEAATDVDVRDGQRGLARTARRSIDTTAFPSREPHDFDAVTPAEQRSMDQADVDTLRRRVEEMDRTLAADFAGGRVGVKSNTFEHRSRLVRQARGRLPDMPDPAGPDPAGILPPSQP